MLLKLKHLVVDDSYFFFQGKLTDGTVFDSSFERGNPIDFELGSGQVIKGTLPILFFIQIYLVRQYVQSYKTMPMLVGNHDFLCMRVLNIVVQVGTKAYWECVLVRRGS